MSPHGLMWSSMYRPDKPEVRRRVDWKRIGVLFAPYWLQQATVLLCIVATSTIGLAPGFITSRIIDSAIPNRDVRALATDVGLVLAAAFLAAAIGIAQGYLNSIVGEGIMRDLRTSLVTHLHKMPVSFFTSTKTGEIMNRVSNDVDNIDGVVTGTLTSIFTNVVVILTTLVAMFVWNWRLALLSIVIVPLMIIPLGPVGRKMYDIRKLTREKRDQIESITQETLSISGIVLIKSFAREAYERSRFYDVGTKLMALEIDLAMVGRWFLASVTAMVDRGSGARLVRRRLVRHHLLNAAGRRYRGVRRVHSDPALRSGRRAGGYPGANRQRAGRVRANLRLSRHADRGVRPSRRSFAAFRSRRYSLRRRDLRIRRLPRGAARRFVPRSSWRDRGVRRPLGCRQDDDHAARTAILRPERRRGVGRRARPSDADAGIAAARYRNRHAGNVSFPRHDCQ